MPPKPRSGSSRRPTTDGGRDRAQLLWVVGGVALLGVGIVIWLLVGRGDDTAAAADVRTAVAAAGCTLREGKADPGLHSVATPGGTADWKTDPPTSGSHYQVPAIYGAYTDPVNKAQLVHNLEHGAVFILYGDDVPEATVAQLRTFYDSRQNGTVLAPYAKLGDEIALGAWVSKSPSTPDDANWYLATCKAYDETAFSAFFDAFQFKGPERFPSDSLLPGQT